MLDMLFKMVLTTYKIVILETQMDYEHLEKIKEAYVLPADQNIAPISQFKKSS